MVRAVFFAPPYTPEYDRSYEAAIGDTNVRTPQQMARAGRRAFWSGEDLESVRRRASKFRHSRGRH